MQGGRLHMQNKENKGVSNKKRVIIFIVEGPSDESAIGGIVAEYFAEYHVVFQVIHGDITTKDGVNSNSIIKRVHAYVEEIMRKYRYKEEDLGSIIHVADMDGAYIPPDKVLEKENGATKYDKDCIRTMHVNAVIRRNKLKSELLDKLAKTGKVGGVPYQIYYMSCNLEQVLYGELRTFTDDEKWEKSDSFAQEYEGHVKEFIQFISDTSIAVGGSYQETWAFIEKETNSLKRYTNFYQIFKKEGFFEKSL